MKIILYFILFSGFLVTVTVVDRLTSVPRKNKSVYEILKEEDPRSINTPDNQEEERSGIEKVRDSGNLDDFGEINSKNILKNRRGFKFVKRRNKAQKDLFKKITEKGGDELLPKRGQDKIEKVNDKKSLKEKIYKKD